MGFKKELDELYKNNQMEEFYKKAIKYTTYKIYKKGYVFSGMEKQDVVQEVVISVFKNLHKHDANKGSISTFVFSIIEFRIMQWLHTSAYKKYNMFNSDPYDDIIEDEHCDDALCDEDIGYLVLDFKQSLSSVNLSKKETEILKLKYSGYGTNEIASIFGCSKNNVSNIWKTTKEKLYKII
jgi:RNA polymerase sigma factor (sigma-70 family)